MFNVIQMNPTLITINPINTLITHLLQSSYLQGEAPSWLLHSRTWVIKILELEMSVKKFYDWVGPKLVA